MLSTHFHATWTSSLYAGMNAAMGAKWATGFKPATGDATPATQATQATPAAKASSRVIPTPRIPLQT